MFTKNLYKVSPIFAFLMMWSGPLSLVAYNCGHTYQKIFLGFFLISALGSIVTVFADAMRPESTTDSVWKNFYTGAFAGGDLAIKIIKNIKMLISQEK